MARWMPFMLNARSDEYVFTSGAAAGEPETARLSQYNVNADLGSVSTVIRIYMYCNMQLILHLKN